MAARLFQTGIPSYSLFALSAQETFSALSLSALGDTDFDHEPLFSQYTILVTTHTHHLPLHCSRGLRPSQATK